MNPSVVPPTESDLHSRSTFGLSVTGVIALVPMIIIDISSGDYLLALVAQLLLIACAVNIVTIVRGKFYPAFNCWLLIPGSIAGLMYIVVALGAVGVYWAYPIIMAFYSIVPERRAWIANAVLLVLLMPVLYLNLEPHQMIRAVATTLVVSVFSVIFTRVINRQQQLLSRQLLIDPLTQLYNRSSLESTISHTLALNQRSGVKMTLLSIDVDNFKQINDNDGHAAGDQVLKKLGSILRENVRRSDYVFRMGGEEFLVLLSGADLTAAGTVAEKLRTTIQATPFLPERTVTVSMGVATLQERETADKWLTRADRLLYKAKEAGRNRVITA